MITLDILDPVHVETNMEGKVNLNQPLSYKVSFWGEEEDEEGEKKKKRQSHPVYLIQTLSDSQHIFPTGLLPRAIAYLDELGMQYKVTGSLGEAEYDKPGIKGVIFRPDQKKLIKAALINGRGVLQAPTGSGKTMVLLGIISAFKQERILFLCHTVTLVTQFKEELIKWGFNTQAPSGIGILSGGKNTVGRIQLATIQSFVKLHPRDYINMYDVILVDEAHHVSTYTGRYAWVLQRSLAPVRIGVTATMPYKPEAKFALEGLIGPKLAELTIKEGSEIGIIAKPIIKILAIPDDGSLQSEEIKYPEAYQKGIVDNLVRNMIIITAARQQVEQGKSVLINVNRIEHGERLEALGHEWGLKCKFIHGADDNFVRTVIRKALESKDVMCVIASPIFKEGVNIPSLDCCINAAGGKSEIATLQALGRGLRTTKTKKVVTIIDLKDTGNKYLRRHYRARYRVYRANEWV